MMMPALLERGPTVWALSVGEAEWYLAGVFLHRGVDVGLKTGMDERMEEMLRKRKKMQDGKTQDAREEALA